MELYFAEQLLQAFPQSVRFALNNGAELFRVDGFREQDLETVHELALGAGFVEVFRKTEGNVSFRIYQDGDRIFTVSDSPAEKTGRMILEPGKILPERSEVSEELCDPLITQIRCAYYAYDCGMCYVIRLMDGRFILIDSGMGEMDETEHLLDVLDSQNVLPGKPKIALWLFSHAHIDHYRMFTYLMTRYPERIELERIAYNWPREEYAPKSSDLTAFDEVISKLDPERILTLRSGQQFRLGGAVLDVLFAWEDLLPERINGFNDTSTIIRMELGGKRTLWLGDAMAQSSDFICKRYPEAVFPCEFLQVGHHGYSGGSDALHRLVDPEILLWSCPNFWYPVVSRWESNDYLMASTKVRAIFVGGREETVLNLRETIPVADPYRAYRGLSSGETLYCENFENSSPYHLYFSCITGGATGYVPAKLNLTESGCKLSSSDGYTVCELLQPGHMADAPGFILRIEGRVGERCEKLGLFWNYETPTVWSDEHALWGAPEAGSEFSLELLADPQQGKARFCWNGREQEVPYAPEQERGIYLILRNGEVELKHIHIITNECTGGI